MFKTSIQSVTGLILTAATNIIFVINFKIKKLLACSGYKNQKCYNLLLDVLASCILQLVQTD